MNRVRAGVVHTHRAGEIVADIVEKHLARVTGDGHRCRARKDRHGLSDRTGLGDTNGVDVQRTRTEGHAADEQRVGVADRDIVYTAVR